jgi:hypothetical protein
MQVLFPFDIQLSRGEVVIPLIDLTPPHLLCLVQARIWISNVNELRGDVVGCFVEIDGNVDNDLSWWLISMSFI